MNLLLSRRQFLCGTTAIIASPLLHSVDSWASSKLNASQAQAQFAALEKEFGGSIGVFALDTADGATLAHRASERFPFCSTFKAMLAAAVLARSTQDVKLLDKRLHFSKKDFAGYSPITEQHVSDGMTIAELCAATVQYSDNTAANLLLKEVGGPAGLTRFARSLGDQEFRLDRTEPALNSAMPGDARDTTTPQAMAHSLQALALGEGLKAPQRQQFQNWLKGNTTGDERIRAGVPKEWQVGDKTGTGSYGSANDIAVLWHDKRAPVVLAIYTVQKEKDAKSRSDVVAAAAKIVVGWLG